MKAAVLHHEQLCFVSRGSALLAIAMVVLAIGYAGWSGTQFKNNRNASLDSYESLQLAEWDQWRKDLAAIEAGQAESSRYSANPMSISIPAVLRPSPLADFATGHADLQPASAKISPWSNVKSLFGRYQFDNPSTIAFGSFDVAMVIVWLLPLLMIAVSFDILSSERTRGSLAMVLSSPIRLTQLVWTRLLFRNGLLWLAALFAMTVLVFLNGSGEERFARFGLWLGFSFTYLLFWLAVIAACIAFFRTAAATSGAMIGIWLLLTLAVPAGITTLAEFLYPTPSQLKLLSEIRQAEGETSLNLASLTDSYLMEHPNLGVGDADMPSYMHAAYLSNQTARDSTRPILEAHREAHAGRKKTLQWTQYLSPAAITQQGLMRVAGADLDRQHRFQDQAIDALDQLSAVVGPAVVSRNRISLEDAGQIEAFRFRDHSVSELARMSALPIAFLLVISLLVGTFAQRRLNAGTELR
jgi:ABC-2 type transport system permease protein